jgi:ribose transport system substrate-binding protein
MKSPPFKAPGPPFDASAAAGKTVYAVPASSSIPYTRTIEDSMKAAAQTQGVDFIEAKNQGQPSEWNAGVLQAINAHADAIVLDEIDPNLVKNAIAKAAAAKIPVIAALVSLPGEKLPSGVTAIVSMDQTEAGSLMADWTIWKSDGKGKAVVIGEPLTPAAGPLEEAMKEEFAKFGPEMETNFSSVPFTEWATKLQPTTQTELNQHPDTEFVVPIYDSMLQFVNPAIQGAGKSNSVKVVTSNGDDFALEELEDNNPPFLEMIVGGSIERTGWSIMDQVLRSLTGTKPATGPSVAWQILTSENVTERYKDENFEENFEKLWANE